MMPVDHPYDARAVANLLLDIAEREQVSVTNLALQKLLYFAHGRFLTMYGCALVSGYFEAWTHGPVHPAVYSAFKATGSAPISTRAESFNYLTGEVSRLELPSDARVLAQIEEVVRALGHVSTWRLVEISHAPMGPWAETVRLAGTKGVLGLRISDTITRDRFRFLMVPLRDSLPTGELGDDTPLA